MMPHVSDQRADHLAPLTGLRFLAALLVVLFHFLPQHVAPAPGPLHLTTRIIHNIVASGFTGVGFFFILSGFILAYTYLHPRRRRRVGARDFWLARVARVYPLYIVAFLAAAIPFLPWGEHNHGVAAALASVTLVQAWIPHLAGVWNSPGWSLSAEAFFYALFPLIALAVARLGRRGLILLAAAAWAILVTIALAYLALAPDGPWTPMHGAWYNHDWLKAVYMNPLARLPEFVLGVALGRIFLLDDARRVGVPWRCRIGPGWLSVAALLGIVAVCAYGPWPVVLVTQAVLDPLFALLIYSLAFRVGPLAAALSVPLVVLLGEASYALYILHWVAWDTMSRVLRPLSPLLDNGDIFFAVYLAVVLVLSVAAVRVVERPARRVLAHVCARRGTDRDGPQHAEPYRTPDSRVRGLDATRAS